MKKLFIVIIMVMVFIGISGCTSSLTSSSSSPTPNPESFGNGVLYFHGYQAEVGYAISNYIKDNPQLRITAMAPDDTGAYGYTVGYFVIVENRTCES